MIPARTAQLRLAALMGATLLLGASWLLSVMHIRGGLYPLLWAAPMPLLAFYYASTKPRPGLWKHLPAGAVSIYAVVLLQVVRGQHYGALGIGAVVLGVVTALPAFWLAVRVRPRDGGSGAGTARRSRRGVTAANPGTGARRSSTGRPSGAAHKR